MDALVSARFFRLTAKPNNTADFHELLLAEAAKLRVDRERDVGGGTLLRIERCSSDGEFVLGDFCRKQITNLPPEAGPDGLAPTILPEGKGIGHLAAFIYHKPTRVILLQHNAQSATPSRVGVYLMTANSDAMFTMVPVMRRDALERFKTREARSFTVKFATPQNLESLDDKNIAPVKGVRLLAEAYHGLYFTVTVDVGKSTKQTLDTQQIRSDIETLLGSDADIKQLRVKTSASDEDPGIDFLKEHLKCSQKLTLSDDDVEKNYAARLVILKAEFAKRMEYIVSQFGPKQHDHVG